METDTKIVEMMHTKKASSKIQNPDIATKAKYERRQSRIQQWKQNGDLRSLQILKRVQWKRPDTTIWETEKAKMYFLQDGNSIR